MKKPTPVSKELVCSACGLPWNAHSRRVTAVVTTSPEQAAEYLTLEDCIALLRNELAEWKLRAGK